MILLVIAWGMSRIWISLEAEGQIRGCSISVGENDGMLFKMKKLGLFLIYQSNRIIRTLGFVGHKR